MINESQTPSSHWSRSAKAGYRIHDMLRTDVSATYRGGYSVSASNAANGVASYKSDVSNWTMMVNGYVEPVTLGKFKPYIGGGIGAAINSTSNSVFNGSGANNKLDDRPRPTSRGRRRLVPRTT